MIWDAIVSIVTSLWCTTASPWEQWVNKLMAQGSGAIIGTAASVLREH